MSELNENGHITSKFSGVSKRDSQADNSRNFDAPECTLGCAFGTRQAQNDERSPDQSHFMSTPELRTSDFYYNLPENLIAQIPIEPRDSSRLLCYNRQSDKTEHKRFYDILSYLKSGDVLVINNTKVIPARLFGKTENGGRIEFLLLKRIDKDKWEVLVKPGKNAKINGEITFSNNLKAKVTGNTDFGGRVVEFIYNGVFEEILNNIGLMPLPPYIKTKLENSKRYQTVYSKIDGSAAAPTAGLHFTAELLEKIKQKGVIICKILLHVGLSTFRPVKVEKISEHKMHCEYFEISKDAADIINSAKDDKRRIIAVGTTSVRTLESASDEFGKVTKGSGNTEIFIYPPYKFKCADALITNFHLPESTLLMLVSAFIEKEKTLELYNLAIKEKYRFFSFGDAMFLF